MKLKVVFELDTSKRMVLQKVIGKSKGLKPNDYKKALKKLFEDYFKESTSGDLTI